MGSVAASGGYYPGLATDHILHGAPPTPRTIGVPAGSPAGAAARGGCLWRGGLLGCAGVAGICAGGRRACVSHAPVAAGGGEDRRREQS